MELNSKNIKKILLIILFAAVTFTAMQNFGKVMFWAGIAFSFFRPVIIALCIAFVLNVLLNAFETKIFRFFDKSNRKLVRKLKRPVCLVLTYLVALGIITVLILVIIPDIADTFIYLSERLPSFMIDARKWAEDMLTNFNISQTALPDIKINWSSVANTIKDFITNDSTRIFGNAMNITTSVFSGVFDTVFSLMISIYILAQKERISGFIKRCIKAFIPEKPSRLIYHVSYQTAYSFSKFIGGQLIESIILGLLCFIGMTIFRFPSAAVISVLICVTSLVPIIGAIVGVIIGFMLIVMVSPVKALLFIVFFIILQQIEGNLIYPKVVGKSVGLPGVVVVCAVLVGGNFGGVFGALIGVPLSAVIFALLKEAIEKRLSEKKNISEPETE